MHALDAAEAAIASAWRDEDFAGAMAALAALRAPLDAFFDAGHRQRRRAGTAAQSAAAAQASVRGRWIGPQTSRGSKATEAGNGHAMTKWVYSFGAGHNEGRADMRNLLGGKGANLAEMASIGLPVPPGFTITTEVCTAFYDNDRKYPDDLDAQVDAARWRGSRRPSA